jgi:O-antigen/teichoic acid export membrane protein
MIGRKTALIVANTIVGSVLGFAATKVMATYFSNTAVGQYFYAMALLGTLYFITDMGMGQAHIKRVSEGRNPGDCFATFAVFKVSATVAFAAIGLAGLLAYRLVLGKPLEDTTVPIFLIMLVYYCAKAVQEIGQSSFDARQEAARSQLTTLVDTIVRVSVIFVGGLLIAGIVDHVGPLAGLDASSPAATWIAAHPGEILALAAALGAVVAATVATVMLLRALERGRFRKDLFRDYASFALPLFLTTTVGVIATNIDTSALGFFLGAQDAGLFGLVKRAPSVLGTLGAAVGTILLPTLSAMSARGASREELHGTLDRALRYTSIILVPICVFLAAFAGPVITLALSNNQLAGVIALQILSIWILFSVLGAIQSLLLVGTGRPGVSARIAIISSVTLIVLDLVLIPTDIRSLGLPLAGLGVVGASLATLVSAIVWWLGIKIENRRLLGYRERSRSLRHVLCALVMVAALLAIHQWVHPLARFYDLPIYGVVGAAIYWLALVAVREFHREDFEFIKAATHPGEMLRYVRGELGSKRRE